MLFIPKKSKYKKSQKGKSSNRINNNNSLYKIRGCIGLKAVTPGRISSKNLISIKNCINKLIKKSGVLNINVFPQTPISKKPKEIRMGKGKGSIDHWVFKTKPGTVICEIKTQALNLGIKALKTAQIRLPIKTKLITR